MINPSEFNKKISLIRNNNKDIDGRQIDNWEVFKPCIWAKKVAINGKEFYAASTVNAQNNTIFQVRRPKTFKYTECDRIRFEDSEYEILSIIDVKNNPQILEIHCKVIKNG